MYADELYEDMYQDKNASGYLFISYAREDENSCKKFVKALNSYGYYTWVDKELRIGDFWRSHIKEKIIDSEGVILLVTSASMKSAGCRDEWTYAINSGISVYPVIGEKCEMPRELREIHWIDKSSSPFQMFNEKIPTEVALNEAVHPLWKALGKNEHPAYSMVLKDYYSFSESKRNLNKELWEITDGLLGPIKTILHIKKYFELKKDIKFQEEIIRQTRSRVKFEYTADRWR